MSSIKEIADSFFRSKTHKKYSEKHTKSNLAPSSTIPQPCFQQNPPQANTEESHYKTMLPLKEELIETIQSNEREIEFLNKVLSQFLDINELIKIKQNSQYDETSHSWILPSFVVQQRKTVFPKLQRREIKEMGQELAHKRFVIKGSASPDLGLMQNDEDAGRKNNLNAEYENRPVTSCAKQRKRSNNRPYEHESELRRSPGITKKYLERKLIMPTNEDRFYN